MIKTHQTIFENDDKVAKNTWMPWTPWYLVASADPKGDPVATKKMMDFIAANENSLIFGKQKMVHTVDGWNPKQPPGMYETL